MLPRSKIYFVTLATVAQLWFIGDTRASQVQHRPGTSEEAIAKSQIEEPAHHVRTLVSFDPWMIEGEVMGAVAAYVYTDIVTKRPADYWELYDTEGNLLAMSWFDNHGIQKTALDRGIVDENDQLEGVFVEIASGEPT